METNSFLETASSGHLRNCSDWQHELNTSLGIVIIHCITAMQRLFIKYSQLYIIAYVYHVPSIDSQYVLFKLRKNTAQYPA